MIYETKVLQKELIIIDVSFNKVETFLRVNEAITSGFNQTHKDTSASDCEEGRRGLTRVAVPRLFRGTEQVKREENVLKLEGTVVKTKDGDLLCRRVLLRAVLVKVPLVPRRAAAPQSSKYWALFCVL